MGIAPRLFVLDRVFVIVLLYLPRLFVYHNDKEKLTEIDVTFLLMEYRLLKYIMNPALIITYLFGIRNSG